jgi:DegV family protein with EDD domain
MQGRLAAALMAGSERVAAWADLLDEINVFPVADGDTGRNLKISLAPLINPDGSTANRCRQLVTAATGNSGNIAAAFLSGFLSTIDGQPFDRAVSAGRVAAWKAVADPKPGTMLTIFDVLDEALHAWPDAPRKDDGEHVVSILDRAVRSTPDLLPALKAAGVVDAGALGVFIFFEGLFRRLLEDEARLLPVTRRFDGLLQVAVNGVNGDLSGYCINTILNPSSDAVARDITADLGDSVVTIADGNRLRVHLHTSDQDRTRDRLERLGQVVDWQAEPLAIDTFFHWPKGERQTVRVMTDAAGSLSRAEAKALGVILLESYLIVDDARIPETLVAPHRLYDAMAAGRPVSTAQASAFGRCQSYESALARHGQVLYLSVGSVYTGNYATASRWREESDQADRFAVMDTGAASGRLGLIARLVAGFARSAGSLAQVSAFAAAAVQHCGELLFLDQLKFLVAGGRLSRSKGFFGDLLGIKPVISPRPEGAVKVGSVRKASEQVDFSLDYLKKRFSSADRPTLLLQFSDNATRVNARIRPALEQQFPRARIMVSPLSLTSGAHMGPGTWGVAFCPELSGAWGQSQAINH